ncbi:MAG: hypothetical protein WD993_05110 [Thermoleophilaceae bacterium]
MAIRIDREQRDAIYSEIMVDLSGTGDICIELDRGDHQAARRHRRRFEDDMRLLDDRGWEPDSDPDRDEFELSMPPGQLARALRSLTRNTRATLHAHIVEPIEEREQAERAVVAQDAYGDLLAQLVGEQDTEGRGEGGAAGR